MRHYVICLGVFFSLHMCLWPLTGMSQTDKWTGTWEMHYKPWPHISAIDMELQIAAPVKNMLYPAKLKLLNRGFSGEYELLLVKKNDNELGIGRNKYPLIEQPFGLGPWMMYLNGRLSYQAGTPADSLVLQRLWIDNFGIFMRGLYDNELYTNQKAFLRNFLYNEAITLSKRNNIAWTDPHISHIVNTDTIFYGVYDPIEVKEPKILLSMQDEERYDRDTVTIVHNGKLLADGVALKQATELNEIVLDSGENYIAFFAENYGDIPPNTANFLTTTQGDSAGMYSFNFANKSNAFSTVMVARFQYKPVKNVIREDIEETRTAGRRDIRIGTMVVHDEKLLLELWDEQVEDGDIISLYVNDVKIINRVEVGKRVKRLTINLQPGYNRILFFAENLGLIAPNTAALRIKAGSVEKALHLSTDLQQNNLIEVMWDKKVP